MGLRLRHRTGDGLKTQENLVERYCDQPVHVIGTRFAGPTQGRIVRRNGGFRFEA